ncbi:MAG TPA: SMP-30/gluconolactonase/LRE family protein [Sphingomonas sp.]
MGSGSSEERSDGSGGATQASAAAAVAGDAAHLAPLARTDIRTLVFGLDLDHPEGVTTGPDGTLYAGGVRGQIYKIDPAGSYSEIVCTGGVSLGLCADGDGAVYVCNPMKRAVLRVSPDGRVDTWCDRAGDTDLVLPNDCAFGPDGSLWVTDSGEENPDRPSGRLLRVPPGGGVAEVQPLDPLHFANGICVDDAGVVYLLESFRRRLSAYANGKLTTVATTPRHNPDGVSLDRNGGFVIASYYPFALLTLTSGSATPKTLFEDEWGITLKMPANTSFFGEGLRELAISNLGGFAISATRPPVPGAPLHYPKGFAMAPSGRGRAS